MSDPHFTPPRPALPVSVTDLPSRADAQQPAPRLDDPRTDDIPEAGAADPIGPPLRDKKGRLTEGKPRRRRKRKRKLLWQQKETVTPRKRRTTAKNPNRPLENKTRLHQVLTLTNQLRKPELNKFAAIMQHLEKLSRGGRRRVLNALGQVYP
jgi:hypothetical protein